jgi:hypothetical protein
MTTTTRNVVPPIIEGMLDRLRTSTSLNEKENLCQTLLAISSEIDKEVRVARLAMHKPQVKSKKK